MALHLVPRLLVYVEAVSEHGSIQAASRATGMPHSREGIMAPTSPAVRVRQQERLAKLDVQADPSRLETELALIAQKLDVEEELDRFIAENGRIIPGFGHRFHAVDPRAGKLLALVRDAQRRGTVSGRYPGIAIALENLFPPVPSEVILPLAGFTASQGDMSLTGAIFWTTLGSLVGALVLYGLGALLGRQRMRAIATADRWNGSGMSSSITRCSSRA